MTRRIEGRAVTAPLFLQQYEQWMRGKVLDVGAGSMPYVRMFPRLDWTGVDERPVADVQADYHDLPFDDDDFDTVICIDALQFAADPEKAVREMVRVLKQQGALLLLVPDTDADDEGAYWGFRKAGVARLLDDANLEILTVEAVDSSWGGPISGYLRDFFEKDSYSKPEHDELKGWASQMDRLFPGMVAGVAIKPVGYMPPGLPEPRIGIRGAVPQLVRPDQETIADERWAILTNAWYTRRYTHLLELPYGPRVLDVGCADGYFTVLLALTREGHLEIEAVDSEQESLDAAERMAEANDATGIRWRRGDIFKLDYEEGSFDTVAAAEILEHLADPAAALKSLYHVCKDGGDLYVTVPAKGAMPPELTTGHVQDYSRQDVARLVTEAGFRVRYAFTEHPFTYVYAVKPDGD